MALQSNVWRISPTPTDRCVWSVLARYAESPAKTSSAATPTKSRGTAALAADAGAASSTNANTQNSHRLSMVPRPPQSSPERAEGGYPPPSHEALPARRGRYAWPGAPDRLLFPQRALGGVPEPLRLGQPLQLLQRVVLDLPDPLARHPEGPPDLLQRPGLVAPQPVAHLDHLALARGQGVQSATHVLAPQVLGGQLERRLGRLVLDEVAQLGVILLADRLLQGDGQLRDPQDVLHLARRPLELQRDLLRRRLAAELLHQLALHVHDLVQLLHHVHRDADRARLVGDGAGHGLADPPGRVGRELVAAPIVELLDGTDQPEGSLLDQIEEGKPAAEVALGDRDHESQVGLDHLLLGRHVAALDPLGQEHLLVSGQQVDASDRAQVEPQRVQAGLDRQVDLRLLGGRLRAVAGDLDQARGPVLARDYVDAVLLQVGMELGHLLLGDLDLLEGRRDLLEGQKAALLAFGDQPPDLFDVEELRLARLRQKRYSVMLVRQPLAPSKRSRQPPGGLERLVRL